MEDRYGCLRAVRSRATANLILVILLCLCLTGCNDQIESPSADQLFEFESAGPACPTVDMDRLARARIGGGAYRVVPGDVLELTMPAILQAATIEGLGCTERVAPYICRVNESGTIGLPVIGDIEASGKTLAEIEAGVIDTYYPAYAVARPSVFVRVLEYQTAKVSITGAVQKPGVYSLRSDQMSLVSLLMQAEGIIQDGAAQISIIHQSGSAKGQEKSVQKALSERRLSPPGQRMTAPVDVGLRFKQRIASGTAGELTITDLSNRVLVCEYLDVSNEIERQAVMEKLFAKEPMASTREVSERLCTLAEQLRPGYGYSSARAEISNPKGRYTNAVAAALPVATETRTAKNDDAPAGGAQGTLYEKMSESAKESYGILRGGEGSYNAPKAAGGLLEQPESLILPVKGYNIPFADVALQDGDSVIVERLQPPLFTVMGLVTRPGNFAYPPDVRYNLAQALAFAGGLNEIADPRYATIYRLNLDGEIVSVVFPIIEGSKLTEAANTLIKPGDIVAVEHTPRTRTAVFLDRIFRINIGAYWTPNDLWDRTGRN